MLIENAVGQTCIIVEKWRLNALSGSVCREGFEAGIVIHGGIEGKKFRERTGKAIT